MHKQVEEWWNNNLKPVPVEFRLKIKRLGYKTGSDVASWINGTCISEDNSLEWPPIWNAWEWYI